MSRNGAGSWDFAPDFLVLMTLKEPKPVMRPVELKDRGRYYVVTWLSDIADSAKAVKQLEVSDSAGGDGIDLSVLKGSVKDRTFDVFASAPSIKITAQSAFVENGKIIFKFAEYKDFSFSAQLSLPQKGAPVLSYTVKPKAEAYYSVGFLGAKSFNMADLDGIWQPFVWQLKKFPDASYMTPSFHCTLPATFVTYKGDTMGVFADSSEFPFDPLPVFENSTFGVVLRDYAGQARPMVFAPLLGSATSKMEPTDSFTFKLRLFAVKGDLTQAYEKAAKELFNFRDLRDNTVASANTAFDNMLDYGLSKYSRFKKVEKGFAYDTDVKGSTRNDTSVTPLAVALFADEQDIYQNISYPILEFMLSRTKPLFLMDESVKTQNPSKSLNGPCAALPELAELYSLSNGSASVLGKFAEEKYAASKPASKYFDVNEKGNWQDAITMYEASKDPKYLERAKLGADFYIENNITNYPDKFIINAFFWNKFSPPWVDLFRLYEFTGDKKYLNAAQFGARLYTMFTWMAPEVPNAKITVNKGGVAPVYPYVKKFAPNPIACPEESVDAWRVSEIGLTPEASGTMMGHRAIFMVNFAPWMLRIADASNDDYLRACARWAMVGRYANFPGYHINTARTTVFEKANYPLRDHSELSANSFHYNHVWPMMCMLIDFLVSDAETRSDGAIKFPSLFLDASAYMQSKFYPAKAGKFYGYDDAIIWMPRRLMKISDNNINYLAARGKDNFYAAFTNQSQKSVKATVRLNPAVLPFGKTYEAKVWSQNAPASPIKVDDGVFEIEVKPMGITAVAVEGLKVAPKFQDKIFNGDASDAWQKDILDIDAPKARALILNFGKEFKTAYIYLRDENPNYVKAKLYYKLNGKTKTLEDDSYPFEFTVPLPADAAEFEFILETAGKDGKTVKTQPNKLSK